MSFRKYDVPSLTV